jgi:hypothetical protein
MAKPPPHHKIPHELHRIVDVVLSHKPKPKSAPAKKRARRRKKIEKQRG